MGGKETRPTKEERRRMAAKKRVEEKKGASKREREREREYGLNSSVIVNKGPAEGRCFPDRRPPLWDHLRSQG